MRKIYYLKTCNTCQRIINDLNLPKDFIFQDIKSQPITANQLEELKKKSGDYESLFSKRAKLYKEMGLKNTDLKDADFKHYILEHYTFLKRPVIVIDDEIFIGNSQKNVKAIKTSLEKL